MSTSIISFVVVLGILIFVHELGHFLVARLFGVGVQRFSLGFGPRIAGKKIGITDYRLSAIPLGGYVKMVGEEPDAELRPEEIPLSFTHKHVVKRMLIVAAGPFFNILLALFIFFILFLFSGTYILKPTVGEVTPGSPAAEAGLQSGDTVVSIKGTPIDKWEEMAEVIVNSGGTPLEMTIRRGDRTFTTKVIPESKPIQNIFGEETDRYVIGVTSAGETVTVALNPFQAFYQSGVQTYRIVELTAVSVVKLVQGKVSPKTLGGPIMIAQMSGEQARQGVPNLVFFIALISINLAILNILPIPVLDGGHILFFFIELVTGRPLNIRVREVAQQAGLFILLLLMVYVFYNDLARIFTS